MLKSSPSTPALIAGMEKGQAAMNAITDIKISIEKGIPLPMGKCGGRGRPAIYPFPDMQVGDSVFIPGQKVGGGAYGSARSISRRLGFKFAARTVEGGIRIWRIA